MRLVRGVDHVDGVMLLAYSWPMRVNMRSAPERSTRTRCRILRLEALAELLGERRSIAV
jgi:hypothetical protein